eukprot:NODE_594_length_5604_cov_0.154950.p1 type:complete len:453 gc:universal NODE_594_length_5604_cov_0.154950:2702-4060(+)
MKILHFLFFVIYATDCDSTMDFFKYLNMHLTDPQIFNLIPQNCCNFTSPSNLSSKVSILCASNTVTSIQLFYLNLNGTLNATSLPNYLTNLQISNSKLSSKVPDILPDSLITLNLLGNRLYGSIPSTLPSNLINLYLQSNQLNGSISNLPNSLSLFYAHTNQFSGSINNLPDSSTRVNLDNNQFSGNIDKMPSRIIWYSVSNNLLSGELMQNWPISLQSFYVDDNQFNGTLPVQLLQQLATLYIYKNQFSGCLSVPLACTTCFLYKNQLKGPITFKDISYNLITNLTVYDSSDLSTCIINDNPLLNATEMYTLPSRCGKTNLFADTGYFCPVISVKSSFTNSTQFKTPQSTIEEAIIKTRPIIKRTTPAITFLESNTKTIWRNETFYSSAVTINLKWNGAMPKSELKLNNLQFMRIGIDLLIIGFLIAKTPVSRRKPRKATRSSYGMTGASH